MAGEIDRRDWSTTRLGHRDHWPHAFKNALRLILNSRFSMLLMYGEDLLTFYNDAFASLLADRSMELGRPFKQLLPEFWQKAEPLLSKAIGGEASECAELAISIERDGERQQSWWVFSASPITDEDGRVIGVFAPVHEITASKRAQDEASDNRGNLQIISDTVPSMLWRRTNDDRLIWKNRIMERYFDALDHDDWVHPDDRASRAREWERAERERTSFVHLHRLKNAKGEYRWHFAKSEPCFDDKGNIIEWVGVSTDIHDKRMAVEALPENESLFAGFARNSSNALWIASLVSGEFKYVNRAFHRIWGSHHAGRQLTWDDRLTMVHPDDREARMEARERLLRGEVLHDEYRIIRGDEIRWIRETAFPIIGADQVIRKAGGITEDITRENRMMVHIIDTDTCSRNILSHELQIAGYQVRPFSDIDGFLRLSRALVPGCVILVDNHGGEEARHLAGALKDQGDRLPLILIRDLTDAHEAVDLMKLGVRDILAHDRLSETLEPAVATVLTVMQGTASEEDAIHSARMKLQALTDRERQILEALSEGRTNKMIARDIGLSHRTIETYRIKILERLGVTTLPEAVKLITLASL